MGIHAVRVVGRAVPHREDAPPRAHGHGRLGGEAAAYKAALEAGEIGLERPQGANVSRRADFITAVRDRSGKLWIVANDAKTLVKAESATATGMKPSALPTARAGVPRSRGCPRHPTIGSVTSDRPSARSAGARSAIPVCMRVCERRGEQKVSRSSSTRRSSSSPTGSQV
jgi:hypothetical protein